MLRTAIIMPDRKRSKQLILALETVGGVAVKRAMEEYPSIGELLRCLRSSVVDVLFLSFEDVQKARDIAKALEIEFPTMQLVGVHGVPNAETLRESMRLGIREPLWEPFEERSIAELLSRLKERVDRYSAQHGIPSQLLCFLPSKPGVGASTIALNVGAALAARPESSTLLADFDLCAGMVRFLLRLNNKSSLTDAIELASELDDQLWPQLVTRRKGLDVLHSGDMKPNHYVAPGRVSELLSFLRRRYKFICADLSGNFERHSLDLLQESTAIFLVCAPELSSLHLAREKMDCLRRLDVAASVSVILNRVPKKSLFSAQQVEEFLGTPISQVLTNDYESVHRSFMAGTIVSRSSLLGKQFTQLAERLAPAVLLDQRKPVPHDEASPDATWRTAPWQLRNA